MTFSTDDAPLDFRAVLTTLIAGRWWIVASTVLVTVVCAIAAFAVTPVYRSTVVLVPAGLGAAQSISGSALAQLGTLASLAGVNIGTDQTQVEEALAVLRSRQFTERFIQELDLMPKLFPDRWDPVAGSWVGAPPSLARAYRRFDDARTITVDRKTGLIFVRVDWSDRSEAARWANQLVERLNQEMRNRAIANADAAVGYLEKEFQATANVSTREAIGRLIEAQVKQRMLANVTQEYVFRVVDPALPADEDEPIFPKKAVWILFGVFFGFALGVLVVLFVHGWRISSDFSKPVSNG